MAQQTNEAKTRSQLIKIAPQFFAHSHVQLLSVYKVIKLFKILFTIFYKVVPFHNTSRAGLSSVIQCLPNLNKALSLTPSMAQS